MEQLTIHAHAKINLALDVLNRRPDASGAAHRLRKNNRVR